MLKAVRFIVITIWNDEQETIKKFSDAKLARDFVKEREHPLIIRKELHERRSVTVWGNNDPFTYIKE